VFFPAALARKLVFSAHWSESIEENVYHHFIYKYRKSLDNKTKPERQY